MLSLKHCSSWNEDRIWPGNFTPNSQFVLRRFLFFPQCKTCNRHNKCCGEERQEVRLTASTRYKDKGSPKLFADRVRNHVLMVSIWSKLQPSQRLDLIRNRLALAQKRNFATSLLSTACLHPTGEFGLVSLCRSLTPKRPDRAPSNFVLDEVESRCRQPARGQD